MRSRLFVLGIVALGLLSTATPAFALVIAGPIKPGHIVLGHGWPEEDAFRQLLKMQECVGGHFMDAPTWWDGHFSVTYLYRGREVAAQRMINELNRLKLEGTTVMVVEDEGFDGPNNFFGNREALAYDWNVTFSETKSGRENANANKVLPGMNTRQVRMVIHLGTRLERTKLRIPEWMQPKLVVVEGGPKPDGEYGPVSAFQAMARAARDD